MIGDMIKTYNQMLLGLLRGDNLLFEYMIGFLNRINPVSWLCLAIVSLTVLGAYVVKLAQLGSYGKIRPKLINYFLLIYICFIITVTLIGRKQDASIGHQFTLFWSWIAIYHGNIKLLWESIWNMILFIPLGVLLSLSLFMSHERKRNADGDCEEEHRNVDKDEDKGFSTVRGIRKNRGSPGKWYKIMIIVFSFSALMEFTQLIFHLGLFEWDDMIHNSLGGLIGGIIGKGLVSMTRNATSQEK